MERSRSYAHEDFVIADHRHIDFSELQIIRRSVPLLEDRLHRLIKSLRMPGTSAKRSSLYRPEHFDDLAVFVGFAELLKVRHDVFLGRGGYEVEGAIV